MRHSELPDRVTFQRMPLFTVTPRSLLGWNQAAKLNVQTRQAFKEGGVESARPPMRSVTKGHFTAESPGRPYDVLVSHSALRPRRVFMPSPRREYTRNMCVHHTCSSQT
eukprot:EG_transcript_9218